MLTSLSTINLNCSYLHSWYNLSWYTKCFPTHSLPPFLGFSLSYFLFCAQFYIFFPLWLHFWSLGRKCFPPTFQLFKACYITLSEFKYYFYEFNWLEDIEYFIVPNKNTACLKVFRNQTKITNIEYYYSCSFIFIWLH